MNPLRHLSPARAAALAVAITAGPALAHETRMHVGRTSAGLLVIADFDFDDLFTLPLASAPLTGWAGEEPMFESLGADDPGADLYAIEAAAKISIEVVLFSPGLKLWNHDLSFQIADPGQALSLGPAPFAEHTIWHLDAADPGFNPSAGEWIATFRLVDSGTTAYTPSEAYSLRLTTPAPAGPVLLGLASLAVTRRRR